MLALAFLGINLTAFLAVGHDKRSAMRGLRRMPERDLLTLAIFGGWFGAILGQQLFRHKTHKQPFATYLFLITAGHIGLSLGWLSLQLG